MVSPEDDSLHHPDGSATWTETAIFPFSVPEHTVSGRVLISHRLGTTTGGLVLWDPSGSERHDCRYLDWGEPVGFQDGWDAVELEMPGGLTVEAIQPHKAFHLSYLTDECQADLTWVAAGDAGPFEPAGGQTAAGRFTQPGRVTGTIAVRDDILHVDGWSQRERGWGPAGRARRRTVRTSGLDERGDGFQLCAEATAEPAYDPVSGTTERVAGGWQRTGGKSAVLITATHRTVERAPDGRPLRVRVRGEDELGRELRADGECRNWLRWPGDPRTVQWWCLVRWERSGGPAWGELTEAVPLALSRRLHRHGRHDGTGRGNPRGREATTERRA